MLIRKVLRPRPRTGVLLATIILALPAIPAQAVPCDAYRLDIASLPRQELAIVVAMDEAWQQAYGVEAEATARQLIAATNRVLEPTGIRLAVTDYLTWAGQEGGPSMSGMLEHLESSVPARPDQFVIGLTGRQISRVDGIAHVGHIHLVARRHPDRPSYDGLVVAHEIGHLLGAKHHDCDHDYRCVMAPKGFGLPARWCAHHLLELHADHLLAE